MSREAEQQELMAQKAAQGQDGLRKSKTGKPDDEDRVA